MLELIKSTRPWSLTASLIPILITAALERNYFEWIPFLRALVLGMSVHLGANLTNTYFDFVNGIDDEKSSDRGLVEGKIAPRTVFYSLLFFYAVAILSVLPAMFSHNGFNLLTVLFSGIILSYFYTANPVHLKYRALGDAVIFLCFGPLLVKCTSLILKASSSWILYYFCVPVSCLTEAILHANNARDMSSDAKSGVKTLAIILGFELSFYFFVSLIFGSFLSCLFVSLFFHKGCLLTFLTLPLALDLCRKFKEKNFGNLVQETAKTHFLFGMLLFIGVCITKTGLL